MTDYYNLALFIKGDVTIETASKMIDDLLSNDKIMLDDKYEFSDGTLNLTIAYKIKDNEEVSQYVKELGFEEDWDTMNEWEPYMEEY